MDNSELENILKKFNNNEIESDTVLNYINKIKNQMQIVRVFSISGPGIKNGNLLQGTILTELIWQNNEGQKHKICFTSFEKSNQNKPNFETLAAPDEFMKIVKDCVDNEFPLIINLNNPEGSIILPVNILKKLIEFR